MPMPTPIKAPISGGIVQPRQAGVALPQPIHQKVIRQPIAPTPVAPTPVIPEPEEIPKPISTPETVVEEVEPTTEVEEIIEELPVETLDESLEDEILEEAVAEAVKLTPITILETADESSTATMTPVSTSVLQPVKRRGPPPSSAPGIRPGEKSEKAEVKPIQKLRPVISPVTKLEIKTPYEEE
jgi:hypothetical protein